MLIKVSVLERINRFPDTFSIDELIDELVFMEKVKRGLEQSEAGQVFTKTEAKERLKKQRSLLIPALIKI